ncbi:hypothetical protein BJY04DRAFT_211540 [Aspergillus karnatakaensis]|uniref:aromatic alcohol reductase n=1 Tax=Aspergillus karnatakaensis TaxID=1810916 RepID=UPI003CCCB3AB
MSTPSKNIAFIGASGAIGRILLAALVDAGSFNITAITRASNKATFPEGVTVRKSDLSHADLVAILNGHDTVVSAVGATGFADQKKFIDAAIEAGVSRFLPSEWSADTQNEAVLALLPLFRQKKDVLEYLQSKQSASFSWTGVACAGLFDWGIANGFFGYDIATKSATIWDTGDKKFTLTNQKQLGDALVSLLRLPEATANKYLYISSVETSQNEILAALESATSASWTAKRTTTDDEVSDGIKLLHEGDFGGALKLVRATGYGDLPDIGSNYAKDRVLAHGLLGLEEESVQETIDRVVREFKSVWVV